jgi:hypothetical protein
LGLRVFSDEVDTERTAVLSDDDHRKAAEAILKAERDRVPCPQLSKTAVIVVAQHGCSLQECLGA